MSRRFRDPPPVTSSPKYVHTTSHASSASVPRSARFARPFSTSQPSAPTPRPSTSTSRFRDKPRVRDEIETSFEKEAEPSSPYAAPRSRFTSSKISKHRDIDELPSDEENDSPAAKASSNGRRNLTTNLEGDDENDSIADLEFLESLRGTTKTPGRDIDSFSSSSPSDEDSPLPLPTVTASTSRKRRRLMNRTDHDFNTIDDQIEHYHEYDEITKLNPTNDSDNNPQPSSDLSLPSSPLPRNTMTSRFKPPAPQLSNQNTTQTTKRPSFRPPPPPDQPQSPSHLPPAFSPSHRRGKGKPDSYVPGGAADTVRNWILGLSVSAGEGGVQSRGLNRGGGDSGAGKEKEGGAGVEMVRVAEVVARDAGRFVLVRGLGVDREGNGDGDGKMEKCEKKGLCLIHPHADSPVRTRSTGLKGRVVGVRMGWDVELNPPLPLNMGGGGYDSDRGGDGNQDGDEDVSGNVTREVWKVGVLWDVLDG